MTSTSKAIHAYGRRNEEEDGRYQIRRNCGFSTATHSRWRVWNVWSYTTCARTGRAVLYIQRNGKQGCTAPAVRGAAIFTGAFDLREDATDENCWRHYRTL